MGYPADPLDIRPERLPMADPEKVLIAQGLELLAAVENADDYLVTDEILAEAKQMRVLVDALVEVVEVVDPKTEPDVTLTFYDGDHTVVPHSESQ